MNVHRADLVMAELHGALTDPALNSMNFLNEISSHYPDAISLAAGRPSEEFLEIDIIHDYLRIFCEYLSVQCGYDDAQVRRTILQYGRTKGIVHELVAANLELDEGLTVDPDSVVVTVGCQEAMFLVLRALRADARDVLLCVSPTYVGLTGAARLVDLPVHPVPTGSQGVDFDALVERIRQARKAGLRPRACYVMPDFANPSGLSMPVPARHRLLAIAREEDLLLLEDNPYGLFHGNTERLPTLKALDEWRRVVYFGSFAKTVLPGARVGYVVADQWVAGEDGSMTLFADELSKIKSMITVNTSAIAQAVVGGKLLAHGGSLAKANVREREVYVRNIRMIVNGLAARFPRRADGSALVTWTVPVGGFFVVVTVPFVVDDALLARSARDYGVLWTPMRHFYPTGEDVRSLRLSGSSVTPEQIDVGLDRLAALIGQELDRNLGVGS